MKFCFKVLKSICTKKAMVVELKKNRFRDELSSVHLL